MVAAALAAACAGERPDPAPEVDGEYSYLVRCSYCHDVPNGIGAALTPRLLAGYQTVGRLDRHVRATMPHEDPGSLPEAEYAAILEYMVASRELVADGAPLTDSTRLVAATASGRPAPSP